MKISLWGLCAILLVCVSVSVSSVIWLGKNVFETYAMRDAEIRTARLVELMHEWETAISGEWSKCIEKLDAIPPEDFSEASVRAITEKTRFRFPARLKAETPGERAFAAGEKFSLSRENGFYVLRRKTRAHGVQSIVFNENELSDVVGKRVSQIIPLAERAAVRIVPVGEERGFGIIRGLPGAKLEFELATREHADSVAAGHAVRFAGACIFAMLAAIVLLALRVFSLSEKRYLFASAVSHELKTPIAELRTCTETALGICRDEATRNEATRNELATIRRSTRELNVIVENLLVFSRMRNGKLHFSTAEFSVEALFSRIFDRLGEHLLAADSDAIFDIAQDARSRRLRTSVEMLGRILFNLADNAAKYARNKHGENAVTFRVRIAQTRLCIDVKDDGPGIPEKYREKIFKPFERGNARGETRGLGLGLPISAEAAKMLGGKLFLLKSDCTGTTFRLELPIL